MGFRYVNMHTHTSADNKLRCRLHLTDSQQVDNRRVTGMMCTPQHNSKQKVLILATSTYNNQEGL